MAYDLFFRSERALIGLVVPRLDWDSTPFIVPKTTSEIERYLGKKRPWQQGLKDERIGFGGCAFVKKTPDVAEVCLPLHSFNIHNSMLTLSFLLRDIELWQNAGDSRRDSLSLYVGCGPHHTIFGQVPAKIRKGLDSLDEADLDQVAKDMRRAWTATTPRRLKRCADRCYVNVHDARFEIGCFGDACDLSIYPDSDPMFSCHNLDTAFQQATLLAGLASLYERVKSKT